MINPSELEGEVDHSFFDSDGDNGCVDVWRTLDKDFTVEKESKAATEKLNTKAFVNAEDVSPVTDGTRQHLKQVENSCKNKSERKDRGRPSSVPCTSDPVVNERNDGENETKRSKGTFMALLVREGNDSQSPDESEDEDCAFSSKRKKQSPHKLFGNRQTRSPSPASTENSADADSESSCSSQRSSLESPIVPKQKNKSLFAGVRKARVACCDSPATHTDESDDTVTDVSPLSSPDSSPSHSPDSSHTAEVKEGRHKLERQEQEETVPSSGLGDTCADSDQDVDKCSSSLGSQLKAKLAFPCPGGRNRKNYSFTNDEARRIERENQRLFRELCLLSPRPRPGSAAVKKKGGASNTPVLRLSHSAVNRQRKQERIERENLAFLRRLQSVKPTSGLSRSEQLADYHRHVGYLGASSYPICRSTSDKERSSSRVPSGAEQSETRPSYVAAITGSEKLHLGL